MQRTPATLLLIAALAGCAGEQPTVTTCSDPLEGVWRTTDAHRYHITENRAGIEIFAMFDTTRPPTGEKRDSSIIYAPIAFDLRRRKSPAHAGLTGKRTQRLTKGGRICRIRTDAEIDSCDADNLTLRYQQPGEPSWETCRAPPTDRWVELTLTRE